MRWKLICVGKPALPWAKQGLEDYLGRLQRSQKVECIHLRDGSPTEVTKRMLDASDGSLRILMDEGGKQQRSVDLAAWIEKQELHGTKEVSLLIGGANGHSPEMKAAVKDRWSLSTMTLQHEMALVLLAEQLYRAYSIMRGEPYHRE
jgi:23S rRNA (pseudouridine1915-N3)-methyltransferase